MSLFDQLGTSGLFLEYPTPVVWLLRIPYLLGFGTYVGYLIVFVAGLLALDFFFARRLVLSPGRAGANGLFCWAVLVAMLGPTAFLRIDLITAVLAGFAVMFVVRNKDLPASWLTAAGAAIKLWPALLWPALLIGKSRRNWRITISFWATGGILALIALLQGGWARLFSPLQWQRNRGLQVESVFATVPMIQRLFDPASHPTYLSIWQAWEIYGPGTAMWLSCTTWATLFGIALIALCFVGWLRRDDRTSTQSALLMVFVVLLMIVTNKTFSPQYLLWLFGPLAVAIGSVEANDPLSAPLRRLFLMVVATCALTVMVFPVGYGHVVRLSDWTGFFVPILVIRNILVVALLGWLCQIVIKFCLLEKKKTTSK